jgi:HK97 family phage major capsid protein
MTRAMTKEQAKALLLDILREGGVDLREMVAEQIRASQEAAAQALPAGTNPLLQLLGQGITTRTLDQEKEQRTLAVGRMVRLLAAAKGNQDLAVSMSQKAFGAENLATKALLAGQSDAGGFLVAPEFSSEVIELLRPATVVRRMNPTTMPMNSGVLSVPKLTGGATASYTGESQNIPSSQQTTGMLNLVWKKLAALVPISNDLLRFSNTSPNADAVVRDDLVRALADREDRAFVRDLGMSGTPKGLRYWAPAANVITVNATVNLANVTVDLGKLWLALANANVRFLRPGWLMAPRTVNYLMTVRDGNGNYAFRAELLTGRLWGYPWAMTTNIPINLAVTGTNESEIYLVDFADAVIGESDTIMIDASPNAAYFDTPSGAVVSSFSRDETVIRAIARHDFGMRHDASVALLSDVDWV